MKLYKHIQSQPGYRDGMKQKAIIGLLTVLILSSYFYISTCVAGEATSRHVNLQSLIARMQKRFDEVPAFKADFVQETFSGAVQLTSSGKGKLYIKKPRMMRWDYVEPERQSFVTDGKTTWLYIPSEKRIFIDDARNFFDSPLVKSFLDGPASLAKYFKVKAVRDKKKKGFILTLIPRKRDEQVEIEKIRIWVEAGSYQIKAVETQDYMGNKNKVRLENIRALKTLPNTLFTLVVPRGVIVERRMTTQMPPQTNEKESDNEREEPAGTDQ